MGTFLLTAKNGETILLNGKMSRAISYQTKLPAANESGAVLKLTVQKTTRFLIQRSENAAGNFESCI